MVSGKITNKGMRMVQINLDGVLRQLSLLKGTRTRLFMLFPCGTWSFTHYRPSVDKFLLMRKVFVVPQQLSPRINDFWAKN